MLRTAPNRPAPGPTLAALDRLVLTGVALRDARSTTEVATVAAGAALDLADAAGVTWSLAHPAGNPAPMVVGQPVGATRLVDVPTLGPVGAHLIVHGGRVDDPALDGLLALLGQHVACTLDRLSTVVPLERIDPLTGAGNRRQSIADIASLRADDAVVLVALDDEAPFEAVVALAAHLRSHTRPPGDSVTRTEEREFMVVLRGLKAPVGIVAQRLLDDWRASGAESRVTLGCASHPAGGVPMETRDDAAAALAMARAHGGDRVLAAPHRVVVGPS